MTVMSSPNRLPLLRSPRETFDIAEVRDQYIHDVDIVLSEGFKGNPCPKIEVFRSVLKREMLCSKEDNLFAVASDVPMEINVPCLDIDDAQGIAHLIIDRFLSTPKEGHINA